MIHDCFVVIYLQVGLDRSTLVAVIQLRCDYRTAKLANWFKWNWTVSDADWLQVESRWLVEPLRAPPSSRQQCGDRSSSLS